MVACQHGGLGFSRYAFTCKLCWIQHRSLAGSRYAQCLQFPVTITVEVLVLDTVGSVAQCIVNTERTLCHVRHADNTGQWLVCGNKYDRWARTVYVTELSKSRQSHFIEEVPDGDIGSNPLIVRKALRRAVKHERLVRLNVDHFVRVACTPQQFSVVRVHTTQSL